MDIAGYLSDTMLVCRNGHVVTDFARAYPDRKQSHCERCGAETLDRCSTCGQELIGSVAVPGLVPLGRLQPPKYCACCGARFPWAEIPVTSSGPVALGVLETLLRRLPLVARQLRSRHGTRVPFRVEDEHDLEDLLRAVLPLSFDHVRPHSRTPHYALDTRTDFLLVSEATALVAKRATPETRESQLAAQLEEDLHYYERQQPCLTLVVFVYDPGQLLPDPRHQETAWSGAHDDLDVRCVIAW